MAETISMPKLGFDMAEGTLVRWVKNEGENVNKGDVLAEIETDKATVEVKSSASGVVKKLLVEAGAVVPIGDPIAIVGSADEKIDEVPAKTVEPKAEKKTDEKAGEDIKTEPEAKEESRKTLASAGEKEHVAPQTQPTTAPVAQAAAPVQEGPVKASPLAKKIARDKQVDLRRLQGTGPGGRVVRKDVEAALSSSQPATSAHQPATQPAPSFVPLSQEDQTVQTTKLRQAIGRRTRRIQTDDPPFLCNPRIQDGCGHGNAQASQRVSA